MATAYYLSIFHLIMILVAAQRVDSGVSVESLPGFEGPLPFKLETGYVGVGEGEGVNLFYYFIESERNPEEDPLVIWLSGGPGCTSLSGLAFEIGPLAFEVDDYNGGVPSLVSTSYSWTKVASIIFLDQPVGTGFSYARTRLADKPSDTRQAVQVYEFVRKWLIDHPRFTSNPFYVGGDSYSGRVVPAIVQEISNGNDKGFRPRVNLQGYVLGNPKTDGSFDSNSKIPYAHGMGLISDELYERSCGGNYWDVDPSNSECLNLLQDYDKCVSRINGAFILTPLCEFSSPRPSLSDITRRRYSRELLNTSLSVPASDCYTYRYLLSSYWANDEKVRRALHVVKGSIGNWVRCNWGMPYDYDIRSSIPYHLNNSLKGYRSLVFSGDHDMMVPFLGTQAWIRSLNYSIVDDWRPWIINNQVAGYTRTYANKMTFATIKGCGHTVEYKPEEGSIMFQRWINGQPL
ncbi:PREDICTED: serine carboxypeptidase-like 18 isoform X2 [Tarenaya hassleriana]|uniref:serine carboxypeptidase-like 18 isoform X2 n=1 Tax=Tarenaya hassleriana TaxID=28532 RepID=UPI00053C7259|nr:PREDICTED: serine carboxypeptidase-like 18 isoform X2 [Tarenaya hassleriana]